MALANEWRPALSISGLVRDQRLMMTCTAARGIDPSSLMACLRESLLDCISECMGVSEAAEVKREYGVASKYRAQLKAKGIEV